MKSIFNILLVSFFVTAQSFSLIAQLYPAGVEYINKPSKAKPDDGGCYELLRNKVKLPIKIDTSRKAYITTSSTRIKSDYKVVTEWFEVVCPEGLTDSLYEVIFASLKDKGYTTKDNDDTYGKNARSYSEDLKEKTLFSLYQYQNEKDLPIGKVTMLSLDSLEIDVAKLENLMEVYKITPPSKMERMKFKIYFDLNEIDENGLIGPIDGKRALDYSYIIPNNQESIRLAREIDPSFEIKKLPEEKLKAICDDCVLCSGTTHQEGYLDVLFRLSELDFVHQIHPVVYIE